jgi:hypothetical protein
MLGMMFGCTVYAYIRMYVRLLTTIMKSLRWLQFHLVRMRQCINVQTALANGRLHEMYVLSR